MAKQINLVPSKTYKTMKNLERAIAHIPNEDEDSGKWCRYLVCTTEDGRYYPVFIGVDFFYLVHQGFCVAS